MMSRDTSSLMNNGPDWDNPICGHQKAFVQRQQSERAHQRFFTTDMPIAMAATAGTFIAFQQNDAQSQMIRAFQRLVKSRASALDVLGYLKENGIDSRLGRYLIEPASAGLIAPLQLSFQTAAPTRGVSHLYQQLLTQNPSNAYLSRLGLAVADYNRAHRYIVSHPRQLQTMMIPMITRLLKMSPFQARVAAVQRPQEILTQLFGRSVQEGTLNTAFFKRVADTLTKARHRTGQMVAGSVLALLLGVFVTRMEMQMEAPVR